jgi:RNA 2',3'-cyclic 3'-phosphodiesterase
MLRLFVAFPITNEFLNAIHQLEKNSHVPSNVKWTREGNHHITLFFIGSVDEKELDYIDQSLTEIFKKQKSFQLEYFCNEVKNKKGKAVMIWSRFKDSEEFSQIHSNLSEKLLHLANDKAEKINVIPHCTLARIKPPVSREEITIGDLQLREKIQNIPKAELWKSYQGTEGVIYEPVFRYTFS